MRKKSVISLISYDAAYLANSIRTYYNYVDEIVLGLDQDRISWSGNKFSFDEEQLWSELSQIDGDNKIEIIEGNFHRSKVPIENDNHERNFLKHYCSNDWVFSFDADEELINAEDYFNKFCPLVESYDLDHMFYWILPYKRLSNGNILVISKADRKTLPNNEVQGFVTNKINTYTYCRWTNNQRRVQSPLAILHWSFCRPTHELDLKVNNFGHSIESKKDPFYEIQASINESNYRSLQNFKTSNMGPQWESLMEISEKDLLNYCVSQAPQLYKDSK
jgi:hypothetical protein